MHSRGPDLVLCSEPVSIQAIRPQQRWAVLHRLVRQLHNSPKGRIVEVDPIPFCPGGGRGDNGGVLRNFKSVREAIGQRSILMCRKDDVGVPQGLGAGRRLGQGVPKQEAGCGGQEEGKEQAQRQRKLHWLKR